MTKLCFSIIGVIIFYLLIGCTQDNKTGFPLEIISSMPANSIQTRSLVANNTFIDIDVEQLSEAICSRSRNSIDTIDISRMRAALYRFYSQVKVVNGKYVCSLKNAEEINISKRLYEAILSNLNEMNRSIDLLKAKNKETIIQEIDEEYLNSLLK